MSRLCPRVADVLARRPAREVASDRALERRIASARGVHLLDLDAEPRHVFRIVKSDPPTLDDFRSAYVLGRPKARGIQLKSTAVHMALSVMQTLDQATSRAIQFPQIGGHVVELALHGGNGFAIAATVEPGHLSLWGAAFKLDAAVVDVYPVEQP